jgi:mono/diheme cytochrome c family protein
MNSRLPACAYWLKICRNVTSAANLWLCMAISAAAADAVLPAPKVDYGRHIRPILSNNCFKCHGPDEKERKGNLRLDTREAALKTGASGVFAIVPGKPESSEVVARITASDDGGLMPPRGTNKKLSREEIELIKQWIQQGADYTLHWSYVEPRRPDLPTVQNNAWTRTPIDTFILERLEKAGLKPAPEADPVTLCRRLYLDLAGLPPTVAEVDEFVKSYRTSPDLLTSSTPKDGSRSANEEKAYGAQVDKLLASPHFGERQAQDWLDLSRYGDTNGYENDSERAIWKYRDWVISAFNQNMPFDRFTIEQIAGDLLPGATIDQRTATGFSRNVTYNEEGGADPDEYMIKYAVDRTSTTATVFLGMTMACAECHDHKYDPISQRDFYSLFAFFNSVDGEKGAQGHDVPLPPLLSFATPEQTKTLEHVRSQLAELDKRIAQEIANVNLDASAVSTSDALASQPREHVWIDDALPPGATAHGNEGERSWQWAESAMQPVLSEKFSHTRTAKGLSQHYFIGATAGLRIGPDDKLFAYVFLDPKNPPKTLMLQFNDGSWEHRAYWGEDLVPWGVAETSSRLPQGALPTVGGWVRLEVAAEAVGLSPGAVVHGMAFTQVDGKVVWDKAGLVTRTAQSLTPADSFAVWEKLEYGPPNPPSKLPKPIQDILQVAADKRTKAQQTDLRNHFVRFVYRPLRPKFDPLNKQYDELKALETKTDRTIPTTMVMAEMPKPRPAFVLMRGNYQTPGDAVTPNVPAFLPPLSTGQPANRLGLAQWLVDPKNPLTARVTVNRFWKQFFGTGLVKTLEDFGSQGEFPSHPELLDWLAVEFTSPSVTGAKAWDVKALCKLMVTSAAYRQSSNPTARATEIDPLNRLLSHAARFRLSAESIRDNALAISGLLNRQLGGKSVYPYQPTDYYSDKGRWKWTESTGQDLYRRGLYTFWRRTTFYPSFQVFDAPTREYCTVERPRTNTPLQALVTLNDPVFVEAARVLGQRIMQEGGDGVVPKLTFAFRLCVARAPQAKELEVLQRLYEAQLARYQANETAAAALVKNGAAPRPEKLSVPELAAWTAIGNVLLNLDETLTRE